MNCINCDQILNFMIKDSDNVYTILRNNLGNQIKLYKEDKLCQRDSMKKRNFETKDQMCQGCSLISKISEKDKFQENIKLNYGKYKNKSVNFLSYTNFDQKLNFSNKIKKISNNITNTLSKFYKKEYYNIKNIYYYHSNNKGLNLNIVSIILYKILQKRKIINKPCYLWSYICKNNINVLYLNQEYSNIESLCQNPIFTDNVSPLASKKKKNLLSEDIIHNILYQIIHIFKVLCDFYFCHNQLCSSFLNFNAEVTEIGDNFISPIKVIIKPCFYSSISLYNKEQDLWGRFHYNDKNEKIKSIFFPIESFSVFYNGTKSFAKSSDNIPKLATYDKYRIMFYKIGYFSGQFLNARINYGIPVCLRSFDIICLICSLYAENSFHYYIKNSNWWKGLWKKDEYIKINKELEEMQINNFESVYNIIKKYYIRIDALDYLETFF